MKKLLLIVSAVTLSCSLYAQGQIKVDASIGAALTLSELKSFGISAAVEPKYFITAQISAGLRFEGDVLFGGSINADSQDFNVGLSSRAAQLLKGEYYFSENSTRPFVGLMVGRYTQANIGSSSSGEASIEASSDFGFAPEFGITFNNFRISAIYHVVPDTYIVSTGSGTPPEVTKSYMVITLGFKTFSYDLN